MAEVAKMGRLLAVAHIIIGFLLICFGISDCIYHQENIPDGAGSYYFGIWIGAWVSVNTA